MVIIFNLLPLVLLCVYPCFCFQKCLNLTGCHSHLLHIFMDTFQGCFKDGPRDCRYFAGFYVFLRAANLIIFSLFHSPLYFWGISLIFILVIVLLSVFKPYKSDKRKVIDIALFCWAIALFSTTNAAVESFYVLPISAHLIVGKIRSFTGILFLLLPLYGVGLIVHQGTKFAWRVSGCHQRKLWWWRRHEEPLPEFIDNRDEISPLID